VNSSLPLTTQQQDPDMGSLVAPTNVLVVGVGGQGVITVSKMLAELCLQHNLQVKQSEVHGMAKRGGAVFSHVRFGAEIHSPTIPAGQADILLALEWAEGLRWLHYLNPQSGTFIVDTQQIIPPFSCRNRQRGAGFEYVYQTVEQVKEYIPNAIALDATRLATELGNPRAANTILLGLLSTALQFRAEEWQAIIDRTVPAKTVEVNRRAFELGRNWVHSESHEQPQITLPATAPEIDEVNIELEIVAAWCKGCDICVKMCPERCLILNRNEIVEIPDPAACTGCRLCEWLCPDLAISVHVSPLPGTAN